MSRRASRRSWRGVSITRRDAVSWPPVILVAGEALFDLVLHDTEDDLHGHPGGGPFNTARTIGRLEQPVAFLGRLSSDRFGRRLDAMLEADGVGRGSVLETNDPTTLAIAEVDHEGVARYRFYERGTSAPGLTPEVLTTIYGEEDWSRTIRRDEEGPDEGRPLDEERMAGLR